MLSWDLIWTHVGITPSGVLGVIVAAVVLYLVFVLVLRVSGPRLMSSTSVFSFALMSLMAAVTARSILGDAPTMLGGIVALAVLLGMETLFGRFRASAKLGLHGPEADVVMVHGQVLPAALRRRRITARELMTQLRRAGLHRLDDAAVVILEARGTLTLVRPGEKVDPQLLVGVRGCEDIPEELIAAEG